MDPVKAHRKRLRCHFRREVNGHKDSIFVMIIFVPCGFMPIGIKPFTYCDHCGRKLSGAYPDRDAAHNPPRQAFPAAFSPERPLRAAWLWLKQTN